MTNAEAADIRASHYRWLTSLYIDVFGDDGELPQYSKLHAAIIHHRKLLQSEAEDD